MQKSHRYGLIAFACLCILLIVGVAINSRRQAAAIATTRADKVSSVTLKSVDPRPKQKKASQDTIHPKATPAKVKAKKSEKKMTREQDREWLEEL